jgi:hypothetical protein
MNSNPMIICDACGESRDCMLHTRAEFPPDAAKAWLRKGCHNPKGACRFRYQAGISIGGPVVGIEGDSNG